MNKDLEMMKANVRRLLTEKPISECVNVEVDE